jgi:hypothetical protein
MSGKKDFLKVLTPRGPRFPRFREKLSKHPAILNLPRTRPNAWKIGSSVMPEEPVNPQYWDYLSSAFNGVSEGAEVFQKLDTAVGSFSAVANTAGMTVSSVVHAVSPPSMFEAKIVFSGAIERLDRLLDKDVLIPEVKSLIRQFGLDGRAGSDRSPLELFEDGIAGLETPSAPDDSPSSITLPLRHCIDGIIDRLLKRQRQQEPTRGRVEKISFIGKHSGRHGLPSDQFELLGFDVESLQNGLSGTKSAALPRKEAMKLFDRGALFIKTLLSSLDHEQAKAVTAAKNWR